MEAGEEEDHPGLDETESIRMLKLLGVSSERKSPAFIHIHSLVYKNKRGTSLIVVIIGHL